MRDDPWLLKSTKWRVRCTARSLFVKSCSVVAFIFGPWLLKALSVEAQVCLSLVIKDCSVEALSCQKMVPSQSELQCGG